MEEKRTVTSILDSSFMKWVAFIFATIGVVWIFYDNFVKKNCANFEYEILSETSIFNNQEDISLLRIFIDSLDVQKSHANISFFTIKITNNGDKHISTESYDSGNFGLNLHNGFVIEPPVLISASTEYLQRKINPVFLYLEPSKQLQTMKNTWRQTFVYQLLLDFNTSNLLFGGSQKSAYLCNAFLPRRILRAFILPSRGQS